MSAHVILNGDCRQLFAELPDSSIGLVLTDPPYHLTALSRGGSPRQNDPETPFGRTRLGEHGFMGKTWDGGDIAFQPSTWCEALRVLVPGGHLLVFGGTRTYHRVACAIEDAGFEIRDSIHWMYGTGFPKSLDVSKAIDKEAGAVRERGPVDPVRAGRLVNQGGEYVTASGWSLGNRTITIDPPATPEAARWSGWGTALKPAHEPIIVARKPLEGTVVANLAKWGAGVIDVDAGRVGFFSDEDENKTKNKNRHADFGNGGRNNTIYGVDTRPRGNYTTPARFPANVVLSHDLDCAPGACDESCPIKLLDGQSGITKDGTAVQRNGGGGGASRFFKIFAHEPFYYCTKPSRKERDQGCEHLPVRSAGEATDREEDTDGLNSPRAGAGRTGGARNFHPTVKPVALLQYLVDVFAPPDLPVLDPFTGSGSTGCAAVSRGREFVGFELVPEYVPIAEARIASFKPSR